MSRLAISGTSPDASDSSVMVSASRTVPKSRPRRELIVGPNAATATVEATTASTRSSAVATTPVSAAATPDRAPSAISAANAIRLNTRETFAKAAPSMACASRLAGIGSSLK